MEKAKMKSFKQMRNDGELVRADAEKIDYKDIYIDPEFNPPGRNDEDEEEDEELYQFIVKEGQQALPQMEVRPRNGGGVTIVDGHRRHKQIGRAIKNGVIPADKEGRHLVGIRQFSGNDLSRLYRVKTSNKNKVLKPLQFADLCRRARDGFGQSVKDIAEGMQCSVSSVEAALTLAAANHDVQQMVKAGTVSKTVAVKTIRSKGEDAGKTLQAAHQAAQAKGKAKVTAKQLDGNTPHDLVRAIQKEIDSNGEFKAENIVPKYASMIAYLRGSLKA